MLDCLLTTLIRELQCDSIEGRRAEARRVAARFVRSVARIFVVLNTEMTPQSGKKRLLVALLLFATFLAQLNMHFLSVLYSYFLTQRLYNVSRKHPIPFGPTFYFY